MPNDDAFEFLHQQLTLLAKRVERLEGKVAQLHAQSILPGPMSSTRREFDVLEQRIAKLEKSSRGP